MMSSGNFEEHERMISLIQDLADLPCTVVQQNLNNYIQSKTQAKLSFLAPILPETEEMVINVVGEKILDRGLRFPVSQSNVCNHILHKTVKTRRSLTVSAIELDQELLQHLYSVIDPVPDRFLSVPIKHPVKQHIALVVCIIDYPNDKDIEENCTKIIEECFRYCLGLLLSTLRCQEETRLKLQCQDLLIVSRKLFMHLGDLPDLLREIMVKARKLTNAERCSLFLLDHEHHELVAKVFDGVSTSDVEEEAVQALLNCRDDHSPKDFDKFHFPPRNIPHQHTPCYVLKMFDELDLIRSWKIKRKTLARFILYVKKGYRDAPYHNWIHAFSVAHFAYLMIKNLNLVEDKYFTRLQALVFLVSGLCHDIDHRGTNNSFQTQCGTVLASLYSSEGSVMERHHLAQSMCILNTEGCNIFENLASDEYSEALDLLRNNILATDLASHFRTMDEQDEMVNSGFNRDDLGHQKLLHAMFMTCCDISDQTKDWKTSKKTAEQIYDEFFSQGDLEKSMGTAPIEMMDREKASIPDLQVQFITNLVLPLFTNLSALFPVANCLVESIKRNRCIWQTAIPIFHKYSEQGIKGMDILLDVNIEEEILAAYRLQSSTD
ncbi:cGMP-dependent 3',5'-cyclic phosphodiesterase-like isoform X3 [Diachasmimorpha longicaudata]|uniref:cGMP-dependent 3',5'-cyclic phosphodiesterase-like isoform X3 n=1 Tax=Diachasmimorpha longicaudata TaxID=58733 RepID=UPI0030B8FE32